MSLAQGLFSSFGQGVSMGQQSRRNDLLERQMLLQEEQANIKRVQQNANDEYLLASTNEWLNSDRTKYGDNFVNAIKSGNQDAQSQLMRLFNGSGMVAGGGEVTKITVDEDGVRGFVTNPDGTQGAITFGGSTENDAQTEVMPLDRLLDNANSLWNRNVAIHQNTNAIEQTKAWAEVVRTGADPSKYQTPEMQANVRMINELNALAPLENDPVALREGQAVINSANTLEERDEVTSEMAKDNKATYLPVPEVKDQTEEKGYVDPRLKPRIEADLEKAKKAVEFRQKQFDEKPDGSGRASSLKNAKDEVTRQELMLEGKTRSEANDIINTKNKENSPRAIAERRMEASKNSPVSDEERAEWMDNNPTKLLGRPEAAIDKAIREDKKRDDKYINTESPKDAADNASSDEKSVIQSDNEQVQMELTQAQSQFEGKSVKEIGQMAIDGEINLSQNALKEISTKLQQANIKQISDLRRLNRKDQSMAMAAFASTVRPEDRAKFYQMAANILESGTMSVSREDEIGFGLTRDKNEIAVKKLFDDIQARRQKNVTEASNGLLDGIEAIQNEEGFADLTLKERNKKILESASTQKYFNALSKFPPEKFPQEHEELMRSMNMVLSQVMANLAADSPGTIWEKLVDFAVQDDVNSENTGVNDLFLSRVIFQNNKLSYVKPPVIDSKTGKYVIEKMDRPVNLQDISRLSQPVSQFLRKQAIRNNKKYGLPTE